MKKFLLLLLCFSIASAAVAANPIKGVKNLFKREPKNRVVWSIAEGLKAPESAYVDPVSGFLFLSQIGEGGGKGKDGDGWISKLSVEGKMIKNKWVTGLDAPKGLRSHGKLLWVSDIDQIVAIAIAGGTILQRVPIKGAQFLNDLATGPDGSVFVSDMAASAIYRHKGGRTTLFAAGEELEHPNGLLVHNGKLIIGGWGRGLQDDFTTLTPGRLLSIDLRTGRQRTITPKPTGNLDGIEADGKGGYIVTDWIAGKVFRVSKSGKAKVIMEFPKGAADHAYLADRRWLILPEMLENKLTAFQLK
ncbi:MAG: hypothetical protein ACKVJX_10255 [Verrucomicrobiia bacterium]